MTSSLVYKISKDLETLRSQDSESTFYQGGMQNSEYDLLEKTAENKSIVNLDLIVEKWIAFFWEKTRSKNEKHEFEELNIEIDWKRCEINQEPAKFCNNSRGKLSSQTLFKTCFTNKTNTEQEYSFSTERTTRQTCAFSFMKGFTREKECQMEITIPGDILEIGGGMRSEQSVEMGKDETKEQEVKWSVNSLIKVKPHSKTIAELTLNEMEMDRNFTVATTLSGRLIVIITSKKDNSFIKSFSADISQILRLAQDKHWLPSLEGSNRIRFEKVNGIEKVIIDFSGRVKFKLGVEQHVNLKEDAY